MQKLIIVRHGEYHRQSLNEFGRRQIGRLGEILKPSLSGRITILTSVATRAKESAEILGKILGVGIEENTILGDEHYFQDMNDTLELVRSKKDTTDVLILVTHLEYTEEFPSYFGEEELGISTFPFQGIKKGEAWYIDCEKKTIALVRG